MRKESSKNIICVHCGSKAIDHTDPPVCAKHAHLSKEGSESPKSLREASQSSSVWNTDTNK
jgi:hypothetical protein